MFVKNTYKTKKFKEEEDVILKEFHKLMQQRHGVIDKDGNKIDRKKVKGNITFDKRFFRGDK